MKPRASFAVTRPGALRVLRRAAGLRQVDVAKRAGISTRTLVDMERCKRPCLRRSLARVLRVYGLGLAEAERDGLWVRVAPSDSPVTNVTL